MKAPAENERLTLIESEDYYWEEGMMVFTARFHLKRGRCCGSGCRHCPYDFDEEKRDETVAHERS
ncbi:MAG: DUF5522 domain-containing protein [Pyrinomonadaceae bacterium]